MLCVVVKKRRKKGFRLSRILFKAFSGDGSAGILPADHRKTTSVLKNN